MGLVPQDYKLLKEIREATASGGFVYTTKDKAKRLLEAKLVEFNESMKDGDNIAFRALKQEDNMSETNETTAIDPNVTAADQNSTSAPAASGVAKYVIENIPVPAKTKTRNRTSAYPFDQLTVGTSFFVEATEQSKQPWRSLTATVGTQNRKIAIRALVEQGKTQAEAEAIMDAKKDDPTRQAAEAAAPIVYSVGRDVKRDASGAAVLVDGKEVEGARVGRVR